MLTTYATFVVGGVAPVVASDAAVVATGRPFGAAVFATAVATAVATVVVATFAVSAAAAVVASAVHFKNKFCCCSFDLNTFNDAKVTSILFPLRF